MEGTVEYIIANIVPIALATGLLLFFWGLMMYLYNPPDKEIRENAEEIMFNGTITVLITTVVWALLRLFVS